MRQRKPGSVAGFGVHHSGSLGNIFINCPVEMCPFSTTSRYEISTVDSLATAFKNSRSSSVDVMSAEVFMVKDSPFETLVTSIFMS